MMGQNAELDIPPEFLNENSQAEETSKIKYEAFTKARENKTASRMRFIQEDGSKTQRAYRMLGDVDMAEPDTLLTIAFPTGIIIIQGENLQHLDDAIFDEKARIITCYNPNKHQTPKDGETIITKMDIQTLQQFVGIEPKRKKDD